MNTYGVIPVIFTIIFIMAVGIKSLSNTEYTYNSDESKNNINLFNITFAPLMGILGGGYYLHNITLPIVRNAKYPENNFRNLFIGYCLVFLSYSICGTLGYYGFTGKTFTSQDDYVFE